MYDPRVGEWTTVADLPVPLSSAKMEQLDGLPTILGGFDGSEQNGKLYQYHADTDR